jgi:hypothetical protein
MPASRSYSSFCSAGCSISQLTTRPTKPSLARRRPRSGRPYRRVPGHADAAIEARDFPAPLHHPQRADGLRSGAGGWPRRVDRTRGLLGGRAMGRRKSPRRRSRLGRDRKLAQPHHPAGNGAACTAYAPSPICYSLNPATPAPSLHRRRGKIYTARATTTRLPPAGHLHPANVMRTSARKIAVRAALRRRSILNSRNGS